MSFAKLEYWILKIEFSVFTKKYTSTSSVVTGKAKSWRFGIIVKVKRYLTWLNVIIVNYQKLLHTVHILVSYFINAIPSRRWNHLNVIT